MIELRDLPWWKGRRLISTEEMFLFLQLIETSDRYRKIENSPGGLRTVDQTDFIEVDEKGKPWKSPIIDVKDSNS